MRYLTVCATIVLLSVARGDAEDRQGKQPDGVAALRALAALTGTWEGPMWGGTFRAQYAAPSDDMLLSYSRLVKGGKSVFFEFEVFERTDNVLRLTPHPGGKPASTFTLTAFDPDARSFTFECPENDFPSRIVYHRSAADAVTITLTAPHHKSEKKEVFALKRAR